MPSILNLKFKGNKSFVAFSNLGDAESLTSTWKVCTKVASYLEQGQRLENLSWRLWHLQNLIVDTDNAKSRREFKKLSKVMGDKLDKEKGRSIEELSAPDFKRNHSTDMIRQRAAEKERNREASQLAPGTIKRMQFTFSVDQPAQSLSSAPVKKPDTKPSAEFSKRARHTARAHHEDAVMADTETSSVRSAGSSDYSSPQVQHSQSLHFPTLFSDSFAPSALLFAAPTLTTTMTYGEGFGPSGSSTNDQFRISRPTIEVALDEILFSDDSSSDNGWASAINALSGATTNSSLSMNDDLVGSVENAQEVSSNISAAGSASPQISASAGQQQDVIMASVAPTAEQVASSQPVQAAYASLSPVLPFSTIPAKRSSSVSASSSGADDEAGSSHGSDDEDIDQRSPAPSTAKHTSIFKSLPAISTSIDPNTPTTTLQDLLPDTVVPSRLHHSIYGTRSSTPTTSRPTLTLRTQGNTVSTRSSGPGATATSLNPAVLRGNSGNSAPGGVKAECSNCGATHTPLWRRGLNDELNCNACGLYCKLHKRPRPKSMRNSHGESRAQAPPRPETVDVVGRSRRLSFTSKGPCFTENQATRPSVAAQCYNCHTTATPLWRKDDEGKTVCNACGLYYKLHGSARPISMKSDVIRKRSRHDARRASQSGLDDSSPNVSRRASPVRESSPTLAPDSTTQMSYDFGDDVGEYRSTSSSSELIGALGGGSTGTNNGNGHGNNGNNGGSAGTNDSSAIYNPFPIAYPGPYHPDYLLQLYGLHADPLPFSSVDSVTEADPSMSPRSTKRRRMSTDSASEPPSSAVSFGSYASSSGGDNGYTSASSTPSVHGHSKRGSMEFPFNTYNSNGTINAGPALRGSGNTFWHPPMMPQQHAEPETFWHPPLVPPTGGASISVHAAGKEVSSSSSSSSNGDSSNTSASTGHQGHTHSSHSSISSVSSVSSASSTSNSSHAGNANDDSPMDYLQAPMMQDDELFSAYLHHHDEKSVVGTEGGSTAMYVDSYYH